MNKLLHILIVEDTESDALLIVEKIKSDGYEVDFERVETEEDMNAALDQEKWDVIIADYKLPRFSAPAALELVQQKQFDIPFIVVSGTVGEDVAVEAMKKGAHDYLMKGNLTRLCVAIDKEIKDAEERHHRREAEQKFRIIFDNARDGIIIAELKERKLLFGNRMIYDMLGYSTQEFACLKVDDIHPKEGLPYTLEQFEKQEKGEIAIAENIPVKRKNGSVFYVDVNASLIVLDKKKCLLGVFRDITEQKELKWKLRQDEIKYRELFENMSSGVAVYEARDEGNDFIIAGFNRAAEKIDKLKREDVIGKSVLDVFPAVKEFGLFSIFKRVWKTGKAESHPAALYKDNRLTVWRENYVYKLPAGEIVTVYDDITERKKVQEALDENYGKLNRLNSMLRLMCDNLPEFIWTKDSQGRFMFGNKSFCQGMLGAKDVYEPIGKTDIFFAEREQQAHPENPKYHTFGKTCTNSDQTVLKTKKIARMDESGYLKGKFVIFDIVKSPFWDENGKVIGTVGCARDVTMKRNVEGELLKRLKELEIFYKASIGREERILELKDEVKQLTETLNKLKNK